MAKITTTDKTGLKKLMRDLKGEKMQTAIERALDDTIDNIQELAERGRGYKGPLKKYSKSYREAIKAGRVKNQGIKKVSTKVNLHISSSMMHSIQRNVQRAGRGWIGQIFPGADEIKKVKANDKIRPFFGISRKQRRVIDKTILTELDKLI